MSVPNEGVSIQTGAWSGPLEASEGARERFDRRRLYWRTNLRYLAALLSVWAIVSFGCGILFADRLDQIRVGGFKLGFWFAQQGSIYVFVALIFVYVRLMNRLDAQFMRGGRS